MTPEFSEIPNRFTIILLLKTSDEAIRINMSYSELRKRQLELNSTFNKDLALRIHRSLSWLNRAEQLIESRDEQFIFLWISFNAAYSQDRGAIRVPESKEFNDFIGKLCTLDKNKLIYKLIWEDLHSSIMSLIENKFVFQAYWDYQNGLLAEDEWKKRFASAKFAAKKEMDKGNSDIVLSITLKRIYTLRNQIMHGGATWQSKTNREQLDFAVDFLSKLVPLLIGIMMDNGEQDWGAANYPVVFS